MVYENCKIYGPYLGKDNRLRVVLVTRDGLKITRSYPKYLVETYIDEYLEEDETVDHIDGNPLNNEISNLQILYRREHTILDARRLQPQSFKCPVCGILFEKKGKALADAFRYQAQGRAGPFCSYSCAGKYRRAQQLGRPSPAALNMPIVAPLVYQTYKNQSVPVGNSGNEPEEFREVLTGNADDNPEPSP